MIQIMLFLVAFVPSSNTTEYSSRIKALGIGFAYLIPDYETDLFNNPQLLGTRVSSITYNPDEGARFKFIHLSPRFGVYARYWPSYVNNFDSLSNEWRRNSHGQLFIRDLWMVRVRNYIVNLSGDGYFDIEENEEHDTQYSMNFATDYYVRSQLALNISKNCYLDIKIGSALYAEIQKRGENYAYSPCIISPTGCVGIYKKDIAYTNNFRSWFFSVGGPVSRFDETLMPFPIYQDMDTSMLKVKLFGNAMIAKIGWGKGIPIAGTCCLIVGLRNNFSFQRSTEELSSRVHQGFKNTLSFPVAVEFTLSKTNLRFGTHVDYTFRRHSVYANASELLKSDEHSLDYGYSFGLGWTPSEHLTIDFYNLKKLHDLQEWSVSLQYHP